MNDKLTAKRIASEYINRDYSVGGDELVILDELTIEKEYGWVFFYNSRRYLETDDFQYMLAGNGPLIVENSNGLIHELGTALEVDEYLREFEREKYGR